MRTLQKQGLFSWPSSRFMRSTFQALSDNRQITRQICFWMLGARVWQKKLWITESWFETKRGRLEATDPLVSSVCLS